MDIDQDVLDWWQTEIIEMEPGVIRYRGYPIEKLIGKIGFSQMIWLMLRGELPDDAVSKLLDAALMAAVDHGPQAPSIAIARMSATCGVGLNNAMASAINSLGDVHGGAGEQAVAMYLGIEEKCHGGASLNQVVEKEVNVLLQSGQLVPGFGHRFHPVDPRSPRLLEIVDRAVKQGSISGNFAAIARQIEITLKKTKGKNIPMNIDGATAVIYAELGFPPPLARGLFCLSRSVGALAHAWEQTEQGGRNKGPVPKKYTWKYTGEDERNPEL